MDVLVEGRRVPSVVLHVKEHPGSGPTDSAGSRPLLPIFGLDPYGIAFHAVFELHQNGISSSGMGWRIRATLA